MYGDLMNIIINVAITKVRSQKHLTIRVFEYYLSKITACHDIVSTDYIGSYYYCSMLINVEI